jgi:hypothetical protein
MRVVAIVPALLLTGCVGLPRSDEIPEIAAAPSELVSTGEESCASLQATFDYAHREELWALKALAGNWPNSDITAVLTLGISDLEISNYMRRVASARGDKAVLIGEMLRRDCPTVSRTPPPGFVATGAS